MISTETYAAGTCASIAALLLALDGPGWGAGVATAHFVVWAIAAFVRGDEVSR